MKGMNDLVRQAQIMQKKVEETQQRLASETVEASSGGGMVKAVANGSGEIVSIAIDPSVVDPEDVEMLQDLVLAAVSEAVKQAKTMTEEEMSKLTGGMKLPGMF